MKHVLPLLRFKFFIIIFLCCHGYTVTAQLQANFTVDKQTGCSPLTVTFTNTTTGASTNATWSWNFGNSNSSILKDAGATYITEKTYTVTLTVKDGANTSTKSMDITVYKKPTADFAILPAKGCAPLTVTFNANASPGDGSISGYLWDFGDGASIQGSNYITTTHAYTFPQKPPITLNVTNSYGCYNTITKNNQVEVVKGVTAAFTPSVTTLCNVGESINFTNTSTGSGTLTYKWDFGDGKTSDEQSPTHAFATKGTYAVTLLVTSSDGCSGTTKLDNVNVANFTTDFSVPSKICLNQYLSFINTSTKPFNKAEWYVDNTLYYYSDYSGNLNTSFPQAGEHTVKLVMYYGNCSIETSKKITVNKVPVLDGFIAELQGACGVPVTIKFRDTTSEAVAWDWKSNYGSNVFGTTQNASYNYTNGSYDFVGLTVTNTEGCSSSTQKYISYEKTNVSIYVTNNTYEGCVGLELSFAASPDTSIKDLQWNFGDGSSLSTEIAPTHIFSKAGVFSVSLDYTTTNGCKGTAYYNYVRVVDKPKFDFTSLSGTTICGNTPVTLAVTPAVSGWDFYWTFNDSYSSYYYGNSTITHQFDYDTIYTVKLFAFNSSCRDTVIKTDYIKVLPPFPHIGQQVLNTCDNTRGDVRFTEDSKKALQWSWDFGDGGTAVYSSFKDTIRHNYTKTGAYKVVLSTTNGACTVRDSIDAYVLLKQAPLLTAEKTDACGSDVLTLKLSNYELNPTPNYYNYYDYYLNRIEYGDMTPYTGNFSSFTNYWEKEISGTLQYLEAGKNDLRLISTSTYFGCADTSNFIPLKIHGPHAGFKILPHSGCFKDPVFFTDTSQKSGNVAIIKWDWDFGDGKTQTLTTNGSTRHTYSTPGYYYVMLKVTDADGCSNLTDYYLHSVTVDGPKADFSASAYTVPPNTTVYFNNTSTYYNSYYYSSLKWIFSDGTTSDVDNPSFTFNDDGVFPVLLITTNSVTGCTDTMRKTITVRKVNSAFTFALSYINNNSCPPVIATFTSISTNASRLSWDFGDGGIGGDQTIVSHTYNKPGIYRVVHYSYDSNIGVDSTEDFIEVKGPYALLKADTLYACNSLQVTLTAEVKYATNYTWDFGDGTIVPTTDTFAVHNYLTPGIYVPALILKDAGGCSATSELPDKVIIDSLSASFTPKPSVICDSATSQFSPAIISLSTEKLQSPLQYMWVINEANLVDTSYNATVNHFFNKIGTHAVSLTVTSPYGCQQKVTNAVTVKQGVHATITGADKVCQGDSETFTGTATPTNIPLQWKWNFGNGASSSIQNPAPQTFNNSGMKQISLIVNNGSCYDTAYHPLMVNVHPDIKFIPAIPFVCLGSSTSLTATGGTVYHWSSNGPLLNANNATAIVSPAAGTFYIADVTNAEGCSSKDSVFVKIITPFTLNVPASLFACEGSAVQLAVSGADKYKWINNIEGISNINIPNPSALPNSSVTFTVVGYDNYNCFTDTADVLVRISKLPLVNAGEDKELMAGIPLTLSPTISGAVSWTWSPSDYLNCTSCLNPVSKPTFSITYTLTASNADGCKANDEVSIHLMCAKNLIFIPNAFTPNRDNINDRFNITGSGIKKIRSIIIYSRWGTPVFEKQNININDRNNSWDGTFKGEPMPGGAYVYMIKTECEGGEIFEYRGAVILVR